MVNKNAVSNWPHAPRRAWLAVASIALGSFALVVTELLPIATIGPIASSLGVSEGTAGLTIALPAIVAAVFAFVMSAFPVRVDRRLLILAFSALLLVSDVASMLAPSFSFLLFARVLLGVAVGGFWAISASLAPQLVHAKRVGLGTALVFGGISIGSVVAVPAASFIEHLAGWRETFLIASVLGVLVVAFQAMAVPRMPATGGGSLRALPRLFAKREVVVLLAAALLIWTGQLAGYTYISPFLGSEHFAPTLIGGLLLAYGIGGVVGNFGIGPLAAKHTRAVVVSILALLVAAMVAALLLPASPVVAVVVLGSWGVAFGAVPAAMQAWMFRAAGDDFPAGSAMLVAILQVAIAIGAAVGGVWVDGFGLSAAIWFGAALVAAGLALVGLLGRTRRGNGRLAADFA